MNAAAELYQKMAYVREIGHGQPNLTEQEILDAIAFIQPGLPTEKQSAIRTAHADIDNARHEPLFPQYYLRRAAEWIYPLLEQAGQ